MKIAWRVWLAALLLAIIGGLYGTSDASAEKKIQIGGGKRTATVSVFIGKSEDVHTDQSFVDLAVSDPEIADVIPLTDRSLSILGKKIGTARVSIYGEGKKLIGVYDVEVSYDTSRLDRARPQRFPHARFRVSSVNGRIMLARHRARRLTVDKAMTIAKQFGADVINVDAGQLPQQVMLEVRFVEASRSAGRELGVNWQVVQQNSLATAATASRLIGTAGGLVSNPSGTDLGSRHPFGSACVGHADVLVSKWRQTDVIIDALGKRRARAAGRAEPDRAVGRYRELPRRRRISGPGARHARHRDHRIQEIRRRAAFTPTVLGAA